MPVIYSKVKASVRGASNKLGEWLRDFSPWASSAMGPWQKRNLA